MTQPFVPVFKGEMIMLADDMRIESVQSVIDFIGAEYNPAWGVDDNSDLYVAWDVIRNDKVYRRYMYVNEYAVKVPGKQPEKIDEYEFAETFKTP